MITKKTNKIVIALKQIAVLPILIGLVLFFSEKTTAQVKPAETKTVEMPFGEGASPELLHEYDSTIADMSSFRIGKDGKKMKVTNVGKGNRKRLEYLLNLMNKEQKEFRIKNDGVSFMFNMPDPAKKSPTNDELLSWRDSKKYGVWIDGKRVANSELVKYKSSDFSLYYNSKLSKIAVNYGKHYYQIDLYSIDYYNKLYPKK